MNPLLKRQIRKYLPEDLKSDDSLLLFLSAIDKSYLNFEEQFAMIQRAISISSDELFEANRKLQIEAKEQKQLIHKLRGVINTIKSYNLKENEKEDIVELKGSDLVDFIDNQTKEIIKMNKQKEFLLNELEYQNQELSDYAHMVSHDLKSPLRSIDTLTSWLKEDYKNQLDDDGNERINVIRANVEKMDTLINGILEYTQIGRDQMEFYTVDMNNLIANIIDLIDMPEHFNLIKNDLPQIKGDKYRLQQLFQNLISNAIAYNDKEIGSIEIGVTDKNKYWEFFVKDNGKGIDAIYFEKIFKTFRKLENRQESSGIGLSIVKKIVDLYGGEIWLSSELGKGTVFYFTLKKQPNGTA